MMPTVTSENKKEFDENELRKRKILHPIESKVELHEREIPVTMHPIEKRQGHEITHINPEKFDKAFQGTDWQYIGKNGENGIKTRYKDFGEFSKKAPSIHASQASVYDNGSVVFGDGRHRYAYMRDQGIKKIPMSMDKKSIKNAKKHGYLTD